MDEPANHSLPELLSGFEMHGWLPNDKLSGDENYMDMIMLVTRNSKLKQGSMACALARSSSSDNTLLDSLISVSTNLPFYNENDSDVHSEISAIGMAAKSGRATNYATAYITMPPCKRCLVALHAAGIRRIVTRLPPPNQILESAIQHDIEFTIRRVKPEQEARINSLVGINQDAESQQKLRMDRKKRKEEDRKKKMDAKIRKVADTGSETS